MMVKVLAFELELGLIFGFVVVSVILGFGFCVGYKDLGLR